MADAVTTRPSSSFWASVREALRGSHQDYTQGSLTRAIFLLAVPMVLEMLMESLFAIVDVFWVARLGAESVATVGLVEAMLTVMYAVGMGLGLSATAMVARRIGEKDREGAAVAGVQAITLGLFAGLSMGAPCLRIVSIGNIGYDYEMVMMQAFNGAGDTLTPTIVNFFGFIVLEIPLAYALAIPLGMRANGVYWAITVSESAIAVAMVLMFRRGRWKQKRI